MRGQRLGGHCEEGNARRGNLIGRERLDAHVATLLGMTLMSPRRRSGLNGLSGQVRVFREVSDNANYCSLVGESNRRTLLKEVPDRMVGHCNLCDDKSPMAWQITQRTRKP